MASGGYRPAMGVEQHLATSVATNGVPGQKTHASKTTTATMSCPDPRVQGQEWRHALGLLSREIIPARR